MPGLLVLTALYEISKPVFSDHLGKVLLMTSIFFVLKVYIDWTCFHIKLYILWIPLALPPRNSSCNLNFFYGTLANRYNEGQKC